MEGTKPTKNIKQTCETLDEVLNEYYEACVGNESMENELGMVLRLIDARNNEFCGEGEDITDKLPTLDEALKLREENEKLKEKIKKDEEMRKKAEKEMKGLSKNVDEIMEKWKIDAEMAEEYCNELRCCSEQMDYEDSQMEKWMESDVGVSPAIVEEFKLAEEQKNCMGCRLNRYRLFVSSLMKIQNDKLAEETSMKNMYKSRIPDKKGKRLDSDDKNLLAKIRNDLLAMEDSQPLENWADGTLKLPESFQEGGENYGFYKEKLALVKRLLK
tara:strand:+ start:39 stop:854 length:816 start_codon:yes stop_codon:yes gene_type:complete